MSTIDDFKKIEMKIGTILSAEYIDGADKLLKLSVDFGPKESTQGEGVTPEAEQLPSEAVHDIRQILSGIREYYEPEQLIGKQCPFVTNLAPRTIRGLESNGMILAVKTREGGAVILHPAGPVDAGSPLS